MPIDHTNPKAGKAIAWLLAILLIAASIVGYLVYDASLANAHEATDHEANCEGVTGHFDFFPEGENEVTITGTSASVVKTFTDESGSVSAHWEEIGGFTYSFSWEADGGGKAGPFEFDDAVCVPIEEEPKPAPTGECVLLDQVAGDVSYQYTAQLRLDDGLTVTKKTWSVDGHEVAMGISEDGNVLVLNPYDFSVGTHTVGFTADFSIGGADKGSNISCFNSFTTPDVELTEILVPTPGEETVPPPASASCPEGHVTEPSGTCVMKTLPVTGSGTSRTAVVGISLLLVGVLAVAVELLTRKRPELV